ncbi:MAG TPA: GNAT family N-acetyltransferase [Ktedonobacterales bacterium]|nr:GNAT family N-acetyltransferase [Ktedonobacterales bacterium]
MVMRHSPHVAERTRTTIRTLRPDDLDAVVQLDAHVFGEPRRAYFERRFAASDWCEPASHTIGIAAEDGGGIVGFIMGTLTHGEFGFTEVTALVDSIAVHPNGQRRGIGQQLASAFVSESAIRGARDVYTLVNWNAWDMLKFFASIGFSLAQTVPLRVRCGDGEREST